MQMQISLSYKLVQSVVDDHLRIDYVLNTNHTDETITCCILE